MPYANNSPRFEFSQDDRDNLGVLANNFLEALAMQKAGAPIARGAFDAFMQVVKDLDPTFNLDGPFPEVIP